MFSFSNPGLSDKYGIWSLFHLCQNHPFLDGNKRTALLPRLHFCTSSKIVWVVGEEKLEHLVLSVAEGKTAKLEIVLFLRDHVSTMLTQTQAEPPTPHP